MGNHLIDASGVEIPGTANKGMQATHTVTYNADGKISSWVHEYNTQKIKASRNMATCREAFEIQRRMTMGEVSEGMLAETSAQFAELYAPKFDFIVNPKSSGPKMLGGTF